MLLKAQVDVACPRVSVWVVVLASGDGCQARVPEPCPSSIIPGTPCTHDKTLYSCMYGSSVGGVSIIENRCRNRYLIDSRRICVVIGFVCSSREVWTFAIFVSCS